ncbi:MAG: tetratricopeptide repeat protein [Cyclobacteriaceae bacterium]
MNYLIAQLCVVVLSAAYSIDQKQDQLSVSDLNEQAKHFLAINRDSACYFASEGFLLLEKHPGEFPIEEGKNFLMRGMCQKYQGKRDSAYQLFDKARRIFEKQNSPKELGTSYWYLGKIWHELNQFEKAKPFYEESRQILEDAEAYSTAIQVVMGWQ